MEEFDQLLEKRLSKARPITDGVGLFKPSFRRPTLHPEQLPAMVSMQQVFHPAQVSVPIEDKVTEVAHNIQDLQLRAKGIQRRLVGKVWLAQIADCLVVWVLFLAFPAIAQLTLNHVPSSAFLAPSVIFLFTLFYFFMLAAYLWVFHFFGIVTLGMRTQAMTAWPDAWIWPSQQIFPAFKRALGHLLVDGAWRRR